MGSRRVDPGSVPLLQLFLGQLRDPPAPASCRKRPEVCRVQLFCRKFGLGPGKLDAFLPFLRSPPPPPQFPPLLQFSLQGLEMVDAPLCSGRASGRAAPPCIPASITKQLQPYLCWQTLRDPSCGTAAAAVAPRDTTARPSQA